MIKIRRKKSFEDRSCYWQFEAWRGGNSVGQFIYRTGTARAQVTIILFDEFDTSLERQCTTHGVELVAVGVKRGSILIGICRLYRTLTRNSDRSTIIQSWMYGADLFVSLCSIVKFFRTGRQFKIFWNVRSTKFTGFVDFVSEEIPYCVIVYSAVIYCAEGNNLLCTYGPN